MPARLDLGWDSLGVLVDRTDRLDLFGVKSHSLRAHSRSDHELRYHAEITRKWCVAFPLH